MSIISFRHVSKNIGSGCPPAWALFSRRMRSFFSEVYLKAGKRNTFLFLNSAILVEDPVLIGQRNIREYFKENVQPFPIGLGVEHINRWHLNMKAGLTYSESFFLPQVYIGYSFMRLKKRRFF